MKKGFGIIDILIALLIIGVVFALMNSKNPIVEEHQRIDVQKQKADEMVEQIKQLREQNAVENQRILNNLDE